ncbi:MAG TPA: ribose ABC transporter substrate-binding protein, partial [Alphaproteobacteria bacterium]|nr:ribose ABC transporter substrate-binding protein [Alphaproteobacteria bacterium]
MPTSTPVRRVTKLLAAATLTAAFTCTAFAAGPEVVSGPAADPQCFVPWTDQTKFFKFPKKEGPYR